MWRKPIGEPQQVLVLVERSDLDVEPPQAIRDLPRHRLEHDGALEQPPRFVEVLAILRQRVADKVHRLNRIGVALQKATHQINRTLPLSRAFVRGSERKQQLLRLRSPRYGALEQP